MKKDIAAKAIFNGKPFGQSPCNAPPERLSGNLAAYWSRRIDDANRIVYPIENNMIKTVQCGSHYRDK